MEYEHVNHTGEILKELYEAGKYDFNVNDEFRITVDGKSSAMAYRLLEKYILPPKAGFTLSRPFV